MKLYKLLLLALVALASCGNDKGDPSPAIEIKVNPESLSVAYTKSEATVTVTCNREWSVYTEDSWIKVAKQDDNATVKVTIEANSDEAVRNGKFTVKSAATTKNVTVSQAAKPEEEDPEVPTPEGYKLVWHDEFEEGTEPSGDWWYETGGGGWGNNELQEYVACKAPDGTRLATVKNGILTIVCDKIGSKVYSIRMNTAKSWTYGWFEARLKLPKGKGTWPAFWMMPKNFTSWPGDGELDILEEVGYNANYVSSSIHCNAYNHTKGTQKTKEKFLATAQSEFHVYALEWTENAINTYIDGKPLFSFANDGKGDKDTWPFYNPFYLKLNLAWGGNWGGAQGVDESCLPATYEIDYVRVFQKK